MSDDRALPLRVVQLEAQVANLTEALAIQNEAIAATNEDLGKLAAIVVLLTDKQDALRAKVDTLAEAYLDAGKLIEQLVLEVQGWKQAFQVRRSIDTVIDQLAGSE